MQKFVRKRRFKHFPEFSVITDFDNIEVSEKGFFSFFKTRFTRQFLRILYAFPDSSILCLRHLLLNCYLFVIAFLKILLIKLLNVKYTRLQVKLSEIISKIRNTNIKTIFCKRAVLG